MESRTKGRNSGKSGRQSDRQTYRLEDETRSVTPPSLLSPDVNGSSRSGPTPIMSGRSLPFLPFWVPRTGVGLRTYQDNSVPPLGMRDPRGRVPPRCTFDRTGAGWRTTVPVSKSLAQGISTSTLGGSTTVVVPGA